MAITVRRISDDKIITVRKYIIDVVDEESIWSNEWQGRHVIGQDCVWHSYEPYIEKNEVDVIIDTPATFEKMIEAVKEHEENKTYEQRNIL